MRPLCRFNVFSPGAFFRMLAQNGGITSRKCVFLLFCVVNLLFFLIIISKPLWCSKSNLNMAL